MAPTTTIRIRLGRRVETSTAAALGCDMDPGDHGCDLVAPYRDQAQLTGLLVQLSELHLTYQRVEIVDARPTRTIT